ncbi:uroporphyrinogen decarboxylase family protein [Imperialibacter roseus]|uniref:Uroporphyrinogen decarboxylase family protein n=1 Tax=Imperialibacter roseus TaxID=1324217 RepID=A0ABZ0IUC8_9BACT|nr:uroporphyrinogen decarboxylase family protein [Imperialibacter roseus]WOK08356.1 uroporphyrinogen decarboxylase family protein [Imperialibacter roseus]
MSYSSIDRRKFLQSIGALSATALASSWILPACTSGSTVNKREAVFNLIATGKNNGYIPCGFFVHFGEGFKSGDAAVKKHMEYFHAIDMDFVKIQYESEFPHLTSIQKPEDWANMPFYGKDFYEDQLYVVKELVKEGKKHAPVIATLYSPFMSAGHSVTGELLTEHLKQDPESVKKGMDIITESTLLFARECIKLGVDGFLASTQGGEGFRFQDPTIFNDYIKPYDLIVMNEINAACSCNVLHICDYVGDYNDLSPFLDYPGQLVNCSLKVNNEILTPGDIHRQFNRPIFGGLEKRGAISTASAENLTSEVNAVMQNIPEGFVLGAECALLGEIDWKQVRLAVDIAHQYKV